jgi:uracil-DNA glycosylase
MEGDDLVQSAARSIAAAYDELGHSLGWTFLFSPARTLVPRPAIMLVGANPGGTGYRPPRISCESGNRFRARASSGPDRYGRQVRAMFREIARAAGDGGRWRAILDETPTLNFCPFRSRSWPPRRARQRTIEFSRFLWDILAARVRPSVVLCLGRAAYREVVEAYRRAGFRRSSGRKQITIGWGQQRFRYGAWTLRHHTITIFHVPHLSWVQPFGRKKYHEPCERFARRVARSIPPLTRCSGQGARRGSKAPCR